MAIPTVQQIVNDAIAKFEAKLNQTVPANDRSFINVLSAILGILFKSLYNFGIDRAKQNLWTTATGDGLDALGAEINLPRKEAVSTVLTITLPGTNGTIIAATNNFVGDSNGVRYAVDASATVTGGIATLSVTARETGVIGNLNNFDTLTIETQVPGAETIATVTDTTVTGADRETDDNYRLRGLDKVRAPGGGGNAADYRNWSQEVAGVKRAYPYAGQPIATISASEPPDRTVYIEATTAIDADGIPPQSLLDQVRDNITTDPATGLARQPLGLTDDTLYVEPIRRTSFFVQIAGLTVDPAIESSVKTEIDTQLQAYFRGIAPFVDGIDAVTERNDLITDLTVSNVVQDVVGANGGSAQSVAFDITFASSTPEYQLGPGETAKVSDSQGVTYV